MPLSLTLLMAATAALLTISLCAVLWRVPNGQAFHLSEAAPAPSADVPVYAPPAGSLLAAQLEVDQTFHVQTQTAKYVLTLRDPVIGMYDAVRTGLKKDGTVREDRFKMLFLGTFVPGQGVRFGEFVLGGNLCYKKIRGDDIADVSPSSSVQRVFFCISESYQRAS